jgi:carbon storage regulator
MMLVLTRRIGEEIVIADTIRVRVLLVEGQKVRLGIVAPREVGVVRAELPANNAERTSSNGQTDGPAAPARS